MNLKKNICTLLAAAALLTAPAALQAQEESELLVTLQTTLYADDGEDNTFSISLGSTMNEVYFDIDCGFGKEEIAVDVAALDSAQEIVSTLFEGKVSKEGIIRIYGDPAQLDYLNASGTSVTNVTFHKDLNMQVLNLEHNDLERIDLNDLDSLKILYIMDNPFDKEAFNITRQLNKLVVLEMAELGNVSPDFTITRFPNLMTFDAYHCLNYKWVDPTQCPYLVRLSVDMTAVEKVDVSKNSNLMVLNVSDSRVSELDLSHNPDLQELYCNHASGTTNTDVKFRELDLTNNDKLLHLFCGGNLLDTLDLCCNYELFTLSAPNNLLRGMGINTKDNPNLYSINLANNLMNFATLPAPQDTWSEYYYSQQDLVLNDTYKVGDVIDLSAQVLRKNTQTNAALFAVPKDDPTNLVALGAEYYQYDNGKVTLLRDTTVQLCLAFYNSLLADYELYSEKFRCVSAEQFGKDVAALTISSTTADGKMLNMGIGILGATEENPVTVSVNFGNGELKQFQVTCEAPEEGDYNISGKRMGQENITIYVPQDRYVTAFTANRFDIANIDLSELTELRVLELVECDLYSLNLAYNAKLERLVLNENYNLQELDLTGPSNYFYKGRLAHLDLSNNGIKAITYNDLYAARYLNLSNNSLTEFDVTDADYLVEANFADNQISYLQFNNSNLLERVDVSNNYLYYVYIPEEAPMQYLNVSGNVFAFTDMPDNLWNLDNEHFIYAPQQVISIPANAPGVDLSSLYLEQDGAVTQYVWKTGKGVVLEEGVDFTINQGSTKFLNLKVGKVYCEMTHAAFPQLSGKWTLRTSEVQPIDMPTIELASFTTTKDDEVVSLSLSAKEYGTSLYIDWAGDGNVTQYTLADDTPSQYQALTKKDTHVRVLAAEEGENFKVFSMSGASLADFDGHGLTDAILIGVENAGLSSIKLPASQKLTELKMSGNNFSEFDLSPWPNLYYIGFNSNNFKSFDFSQAPNLGLAYMANNQLDYVKFGNKDLWNLDLSSNQLTEISFDGAPSLYQVWLSNNKFEKIETSELNKLKQLNVLDLVGNYFDFTTLPLSGQWSVYRYDNQHDIAAKVDGLKVDLSSQAVVNDSVTTYRWFFGKPEWNDDGELEGEELIEGEEYTIENGVTTFLYEKEVSDLVCVMTNSSLPSLTLFTQPVTVKPGEAGIEEVSEDLHNGAVIRYNLAGQRVGAGYRGLFIEKRR